MPLAHRDLKYDQRQLALRERELTARPSSPQRDRDLADVKAQMAKENIDSSRADDLIETDPSKHYNQAAARELEPELIPPKGLKIIVATLVSCKDSGAPVQSGKRIRPSKNTSALNRARRSTSRFMCTVNCCWLMICFSPWARPISTYAACRPTLN